jgi:glycosyltransferase involved in cell wall biosynthesis
MEARGTIARDHPQLELTLADTGLARDHADDFSRVAPDRISGYLVSDRPQLEELIASHHMFVLPCWFARLPLAALEAAAVGLACVGRGASGHIDAFRGGSNVSDGALLSDPHDTAGLADGVDRLLAHVAVRARVVAGRARARSFTWARARRKDAAGLPSCESSVTPLCDAVSTGSHVAERER